jgi:beta-glucanase (GH16 family)
LVSGQRLFDKLGNGIVKLTKIFTYFFREAVDLHYWVTGDMEWYTPDAVTTAGGNLVITMSQRNLHNLNYASGMLQSWNKLCFTGGLIEGKSDSSRF